MAQAPDWVILGAKGQVGRALSAALKAQGAPFAALDRAQADLAQPETVLAALEKLSPRLGVLNAAAYTAVDRAEQEPAVAALINGEAPGRIAEWGFRRGLAFVHYSTDYVFDGSGDRPWTEEDIPSPLNIYGRTKLEGERAIVGASARSPGARWWVLRTSWVYDSSGENFPNKILKRAETQPELKVVNDQVGAPTHATHLAQATLKALTQSLAAGAIEFASGIYHLTGSGETTWHGFANALIQGARARGTQLAVSEIQAVSSSNFPTPAKRPLNSRLSNLKFLNTFGFALPDWRQGVELYFADRDAGAQKEQPR